VASGAWVGGMPPEVTLPPDSPYCDLKKGQIWTIKKGSHVVAGGEVIDRFEIRHVTEKYVDTIYSTVVPKMPRYQDAQTFQKVFFLNKKPEQIFGPAVIPQAGQKPIDTETLEYSGFKFPCEVYEEVGRDGNVRRVWFSKKFPMRIKVFDPKDGFVEEVLSIEQR